MDDYPESSLDHNVPLLFTLGVAPDQPYEPRLSSTLKEQATLIRSDLPPLNTEHGRELAQYIRDRDVSEQLWNERGSLTKYKFRVRSTERTLLLPPRRARLPDLHDELPTPSLLHSPFSPLSPGSTLYPDGILDVRWLWKHQELIPSVLLCFYHLTSDPTLATLHDNQIKVDLNNIRNHLSLSGYGTRPAVVFVSDQVSRSADGMQERLDSIRKACRLDSKAFFLVPPQESRKELERMAENMLTNIYGLALDYYRDLGRHARKKRSRGVAPQPTVPPTNGTSQTLTLAGWNVRYDFKSAIFAEYRQEMDAALRSYDQAYENLLGSEVLDIIPSWSPRWNEARFLADITATRHLRCLLWMGQYTTSVRKWQSHRERMADLVDRRGRGTRNYGWEAWEARWAIVMANLIERVGIDTLTSSVYPLYMEPEKAVMLDKLKPWERLHHTGYWYRVASKHLYARRAFAHGMSENDRKSPGNSPASWVASKAFTNDNYMCPDPHEEYPLVGKGVNHSEMIVKCLTEARLVFERRGQHRLAAELCLESAKEFARVTNWQAIIEILRPLWENMTFRNEGWLGIAEDLAWNLRLAAVRVGQADLVLAIDWELLGCRFSKRPEWPYDMSKSLEGMTPETKPVVQTSDECVLSFLSASFVFRHEEGNAGQSIKAQMSIVSNAHYESVPVEFGSLQIGFQGSIKPIIIQHVPAQAETPRSDSTLHISRVALVKPGDVDDMWIGSADLTLMPGQTLVIEMNIALREPGDSQAESLKLSILRDDFTLEHTSTFQDVTGACVWYSSPRSKKQIVRPKPSAMRVLPRPPKMEIKDVSLRSQYYINEPMVLEFEVVNAEDVEASAQIDAILFGDRPPAFDVLVAGSVAPLATSTRQDDSEESLALGVPAGKIASGKSVIVALRISPVDRTSRYDLTIRVNYRLSTDTQTPIAQTTTFFVNVAHAFEANYDLLARLNPDPWPSVFDPETVQDLSGEEDTRNQPKGLSQTWCLVTRYASFASEDLQVVDVDIQIQASPPIQCTTSKRLALPEGGRPVKPNSIDEASFEIIAKKRMLDDRSHSMLDVSFIIKWKRLNTGSRNNADSKDSFSPINTTVLPVPRLSIFGMEPRVLALATSLPRTAENLERLVALDIFIENASSHFLTFGVSMEPNDQFAFSGPRSVTLNVLPVSRRSLTYRLLPRVEPDGGSSGSWVRVGLVVRDKYFQKVLRVIPTEGMKLEKGELLVWVPAEAGDEQ